MSKAFTFNALMLGASVFLSVSCALEKATVTRSLKITTSNSSTVPFDGHLYTVTKSQSHIHINSTDANYKPCDIAIDASKDVTHGHLEITASDDEIFIVGTQTTNGHKYTLLKVNPKACSYESVSISQTNDERGFRDFPTVIKQRSATDVFFPRLQNCAPCRFNDAGLRSARLTSQISNKVTPSSYYVRFVDPMDVYFYVDYKYNFSSSVQKSSLKLLDTNDFSTKKERVIEFPVYTVSKQKKSIGQLGVCTKILDRRIADISAIKEVHCESLNPNLETTNTIRILFEDSQPTIVSSISYEFDNEGNSYISFAEGTKLRLYIHDKDGKLVKAIDMGKVDAEFEKYPDHNPLYFDAYDFWDVNGFLVGDEYCIVSEQVAVTYQKPLHQVKCVDVEKYIKN